MTTMKCCDCRGEMKVKRIDYCYTECGLRDVVLKNQEVLVCDHCPAYGPVIYSMAGLHRCIRLAVFRKKVRTAAELKFLAKTADDDTTEFHGWTYRRHGRLIECWNPTQN